MHKDRWCASVKWVQRVHQARVWQTLFSMPGRGVVVSRCCQALPALALKPCASSDRNEEEHLAGQVRTATPALVTAVHRSSPYPLFDFGDTKARPLKGSVADQADLVIQSCLCGFWTLMGTIVTKNKVFCASSRTGGLAQADHRVS